MHNVWVVDSDEETVYLSGSGDPYCYETVPAIAGGKPPPSNERKLILGGGMVKTIEDIHRDKYYEAHTGDKIIDHCAGGAGVGDPLDRDINSVREDVITNIERTKIWCPMCGRKITPQEWNNYHGKLQR